MKTGILVSCAVALAICVGAADAYAINMPAKKDIGYCLKGAGFPIPDDLKPNARRRPPSQSGRSATQNAVQNVTRGAVAAATARAQQQAQAQAQAQQNQTTQQTTQSSNGVTSTTATEIVVPDANQAPSQPSALQQLHAQNQGQLTNTFGGLLKEFKRRACYVYGDAELVNVMASTLLVSPPQLFNKVQVELGQQHGRLSEPGLMDFPGAQEVITEILTAEVAAIWIFSEANGAQGVELSQDIIDTYVNANINNLRNDPDNAQSLRMRVWEWIVEITLDNQSNTSKEQDFIRFFEDYIKGEHIRLAQTVESNWDAHVASKRPQGLQSTSTRHVTFETDTYDPHLDAKRNLTMAAHSSVMVASVALNLQAHKSKAAKLTQRLLIKAPRDSMSEADIAAGAMMRAVDKALKSGRFRSGTAGVLQRTFVKAGGKIAKTAVAGLLKTAAKLTIRLISKAFNAIPMVGQIIDFVISIAMEIPELIEADKREVRITNAVSNARNMNVSLRNMLNTREGYDTALLFFSRATGSHSPETVDIKSEASACQVCFYTGPNFTGESSCATGTVDNLNNVYGVSRTADFDNTIVSVKLYRDDTCPRAHVVLYENERGTGKNVTVRDSIADLQSLKDERLTGDHWAGQASSLEFKGSPAPACEVCVYDNTNFRGARACIGAPLENLSAINMNERISSIKFNTAACPDAKIWAYHKPGFKRQQDTQNDIAEYSRSVGNVGTVHNDAFSSIYFSDMGVNTFKTTAAGGCRACLYEHTNFRGEYVCLSFTDQGMAQAGNSFTAIPKLSEVSSVDSTVNFGNKASSVQFITDHCNPGDKLELELHTDSNYRGDMTLLTKSSGNLGRFNDRVYSVRLKAVSEEVTRNNMCRVCVYDGKNYNGDKRCVTAKMSLQMLKFSNKASSLKFETPGCSKTAAATFFDGEMKGDRAFTYKDIPDLSKIRRGAKGNWDNRTSYIDFGPALKTNLEQWYLRNKQKTPWVN